MKTVSFSEFRKQASSLFSEVEKGEVIHIIRHGRIIAEVSPFNQDEKKTPAWKAPGLRITSKGEGLTQAILDDRELSER